MNYLTGQWRSECVSDILPVDDVRALCTILRRGVANCVNGSVIVSKDSLPRSFIAILRIDFPARLIQISLET
jgi:hypothetical protein